MGEPRRDPSRGFPPPVDMGIPGFEDAVLIGQGGFGSVYRARQVALDRIVAIKVLSVPGVEDDTVQRFERECRAVGALSGHPNIVTVYDCGINAWHRPFIVMDHLGRGSLKDAIVDGPLPWTQAVDIAVKLAGAVETAHRAGVLHRDIKPENVLLSSYGEPKLADFGISSLSLEHATTSGAITASLAHAAPELLDGAKASVAADLYALGSTLFTLLAGHGPHAREDDETVQALIARVVSSPVPDLRPRGVPDAVCRVIERSLEKDPASRPASAADLGAALQSVEEDHGVPRSTMVIDPGLAEVTADRFSLVDRFAPTGGESVTGPTRARVRPVLVPGPISPEVTPPTRRKWVIAAAAVLLVAASTVAAVALIGDDERPEPPATSDEPTLAARDEAGSARSKDRAGANRKKDPAGNRRGGRVAQIPSSGGGFGSFSSSVPEGAGTSNEASGSDRTDPGGTTANQPEKKPPPPPPPAPENTLYHLRNEKSGEHFVTTNGARAYNLDDEPNWSMVQVGRVYTEPTKGATAIQLDDGTAYIFTSPSPETRPATNTTKLYRVTHPNGDIFYTTSFSEAGRADGDGWNTPTVAGYVGYS